MPLTAEQRQTLIARGGELHRLALRENRKLTDTEQTELTQIEAQLDQSEYEGRHNDAQRRFASGIELRTKRQLRPGEIRIYKPTDKLADDSPKPYDGPGLGYYVRGIALGKWDHAEELRALAEGTLGGGGYIVPTPLSLTLIDYLRNQAKVVQAGAETIPMDSATLKMARLAGDVPSAWKAENAPFTEADTTFEQVLFSAKTLMALTKISIELLEDSTPAIDSIVSNSIAKSMALSLDYACLYGDGLSNNPVGIKNQSGVTLTNVGDKPSNTHYTPYVQGIATLQSANVPGPFGLIYNARTNGDFNALVDTLGQPLRMPDLLDKAGHYVSNQIPSNLTAGSPPVTGTSDCFVAQWDQLMIGMRTSIAMEISRVAADSNSSAFSNLQVFIRAYLRADVQLRHTQAFNILTGITH